ncbi:unnamed protein product [Amoebophrya sp. A120]|nr:unnamed protein product [Amoebophrya sp. A120]|eukprot:GSA120T00012180001.1
MQYSVFCLAFHASQIISTLRISILRLSYGLGVNIRNDDHQKLDASHTFLAGSTTAPTLADQALLAANAIMDPANDDDDKKKGAVQGALTTNIVMELAEGTVDQAMADAVQADVEAAAIEANANAASVAAKIVDVVQAKLTAASTPATAELCTCVNEGDVDKYTAPASDAANQAWLNTTLQDDGSYQDTTYGEKYVDQYSGYADYGEYCLGWEDECDSGVAGDNTQCTITDKSTQCNVAEASLTTNTATVTVPAWCAQKWCYVRTASAPNGAIAKKDASAPPACSNIADMTISRYGNFNIWYSLSQREMQTGHVCNAKLNMLNNEQRSTSLRSCVCIPSTTTLWART